MSLDVPDFAFADTVSTRDLDDLPPPSGPIIVSDPLGQTHQLTPIVYPVPHGEPRPGALAEMRELWSATIHIASDRPFATSPIERTIIVLRRMRALWQFWQWERTDVLRGAMIGIAVFLAAATVLASTFLR